MGARSSRSRTLWIGLMALLAIVVWESWRLRRVRPEVFYETRGEYETARVVERESTGASRTTRLFLRNQGGDEVAEAYFRRPLVLADDYRVLVTYAGAKTGRGILDLIPERPDIALLALQYPYVKPTTFGGKVRWVADVRRAAYRTVAGGMLGVSYLVQEEGLAAERITIVGTSLGSIFGALHGSLDERVSRVVLVHGGGDFPHLLRTFADRWWEVPLATLLSRVLLRSFDPVLYVSEISPRELVMIAARHDDRFPVESSKAVFDAARQPKSWIWTDSSHVRSADEALVQILVREIDRLFVPSGSSR